MMKAHKSIRNHQPKHLVNQFHRLIDDVQENERIASLVLRIVCDQLNIAVCDYCGDEWFDYTETRKAGNHFVSGSFDGLLVQGSGACCKWCLDKLHAETPNMDDDEYDALAREIGYWLATYDHRLPEEIGQGFRGDDVVQKYYKQWRSQ